MTDKLTNEQMYNIVAKMYDKPHITTWVRIKLKFQAIWWILMGHGVIFNTHIKGEFTIMSDNPTFAGLSYFEHEDCIN